MKQVLDRFWKNEGSFLQEATERTEGKRASMEAFAGGKFLGVLSSAHDFSIHHFAGRGCGSDFNELQEPNGSERGPTDESGR